MTKLAFGVDLGVNPAKMLSSISILDAGYSMFDARYWMLDSRNSQGSESYL